MSQLTKNEWGEIKQLLRGGQFKRNTIAKMRHRSPTVVRQVSNSNSYVDYKAKYIKRFKPTFLERIQLWLQ